MDNDGGKLDKLMTDSKLHNCVITAALFPLNES